MKRLFIRTAWLPLILAAANAFGQPPTTTPEGIESAAPAAAPAAEFTASLLLLSANWSVSPDAKQIEADLRSALKDEPVNARLLEELPKSATTILFPRQAGSVYSEERFSQFLQWLTVRKVVLTAEPFWSLKKPVGADHGPSSRLMVTMTAVTLGLSAPSDTAAPYFMQTAEYQWGITSQTESDHWWIGRELYHYEQARGEKTAKRIRTNEFDRCEFTFPPLDLGQVFVVPAFPEFDGRARDVNQIPRKPLALIVVERRKAAQAAAPAEPQFVLPDRVERIDARHHRGSRSGLSGMAEPFEWPRQATAPSADGSPPATDPLAAPPVDTNGKPVGSAARQVTDGKIIIAWSEGKDVAWGFSTSIGKWARQEIKPPANGSTWPIVGGGGSSMWQVGSAYYGFSGNVAQWDVLRLPDGHEPKPAVLQDLVVVNDGTAFYAFSAKTARWDALRLPDDHKPAISYDGNYVRVSDGDDVYVFADATGRWSSTKDAASAANTPDNTAYKVFSLAHSRALDLERIISQILGRDVDSIAADERTNSIILRGRPEPLEVARALILRLDIEPEPEAKGVGASNSDRRNSTAPTRSAAELTKQYAAKEQQAAEIAAQLRELQAENASNKAQVQKLTADLRRAVSAAFAARQQLHQVELAELSQRMRQIEQTVQLRSRISEQIIDRRVQDLLNPDLQWDQLAESGPRLPSKVMPAPATGSSSTSSSRPRVLVGAAFGAWADEICDALGLTVHRLKKEELQDQKLLGCLKITAISEDGPASEFQVGDIITMMQTEGISRVGMRRVTMSLLRGTERIPVTVEFPSPQQSDTPASTPRPRVMYGAAFGADADKVWNSIGIKVQLLTFDETAPDHKHLGCPRITFVDPDGPAHELQVGDLIVTLQVGSTGRDFVYATLDILRGMETFRVVVEYPSPPPTKGQSASSPTKGQSASPLRRLREPKVSVGFGSEAFRICESLGLTVQNLKKDEISDPKLISALKISAISSDSPASELKVGDIITMMQTSGTLGGARRLTMNILRGAETFPVTVEYPLELPSASSAGPPTEAVNPPLPTPEIKPGAGSAPAIVPGQPLILRSAEAFRKAIYELQQKVEGYKQSIATYRQKLADPSLAKTESERVQYSLDWSEQHLNSDEQDLAFIREEYATQIRLLQLALQDAESEAATAKENARSVEALYKTARATVAEATTARQSAVSAEHQVDQLKTLLELYRKADPATPAPNQSSGEKPPASTVSQPSSVDQAEVMRAAEDFDHRLKWAEGNLRRLEDIDAINFGEAGKTPTEKVKLKEQSLTEARRVLATTRAELPALIRRLDQTLQDAQSKSAQAQDIARNLDQAVAKGEAPRPQAQTAEEIAKSSLQQVERLKTLLDLYRQADPTKAAPTEATDGKSPKPIAKPKQGEEQPR